MLALKNLKSLTKLLKYRNGIKCTKDVQYIYFHKYFGTEKKV
jgi:hypothetical protein